MRPYILARLIIAIRISTVQIYSIVEARKTARSDFVMRSSVCSPLSPLVSSGLESVLLQENGLDRRRSNLKFPITPYQHVVDPVRFYRTDQRPLVPDEVPVELYPLKRQ